MPADPIAIPHVEPAALATMIEPARTALVVIDVQTDFASPTGAMARFGADMSGVEPAVERIEALIDAARRAGATLAFARVVSSPDTDSSALKLLNARKGGAPDDIAICRDGQPGAATISASDPSPATSRSQSGCSTPSTARGLTRRCGRGGSTPWSWSASPRPVASMRPAETLFHRDYNVFVVSDATDA